MSDISNFFDGLSSEYEESFIDNELAKWARSRAHSIYFNWLSDCNSVIDIGCGPGMDCVYLASLKKNVVAIDISEKMAKQTYESIMKNKLGQYAKIICCDFLSDEYDIKGFDSAILGFGVANCVDNLNSIFQKVNDLVKSEGILIISTLGRWCFWDTLLQLKAGRLNFRWIRQPHTTQNHGAKMEMRYWSLNDIIRSAQPYWTPIAHYGVGSILPPAYTDTFFLNRQNLRNLLMKCDEKISKYWISAFFSDMVWVVLKKK